MVKRMVSSPIRNSITTSVYCVVGAAQPTGTYMYLHDCVLIMKELGHKLCDGSVGMIFVVCASHILKTLAKIDYTRKCKLVACKLAVLDDLVF